MYKQNKIFLNKVKSYVNLKPKMFSKYIFLIKILQNLGGEIGEGHGWTDGWTLIGHK